ncbi:MAG: hypothetical protein NW237_03315 [Cyanobacteriota bacterium]|nr:hypothetical protein [Cyanobacteriota bacterium]
MSPEPFVNPPLYSVVAVTNAFAVMFGIIFKDMLEYRVALWQANRDQQAQIEYVRPGLVISYLLTCLWVGLFLAACFLVIGFTPLLSGITAAIMVVLTGGLIWWQLGSLLQLLAVGGSEAIDIDSYGVGGLLDRQPKE